jgi:hypothetical protein
MPGTGVIRRWTCAALCGAAFAGTAAAGPLVTVYSNDLAYVRETRTFETRAGRDTLRLADVPDRIDFTSVRFDPSGGARVAGLAHLLDLDTGERLLERARGARVRIVQEGDRAVEGTLVSADGGWLLIRGDDGMLHSIARAAVHEVASSAPMTGLGRPTLEIALDGAKAGRTEARLDYLTRGLSWSAEHTLIRGAGRAATWSAGVTVSNMSGVSFADATLKLVAGSPRRAGAPPIPSPKLMRTAMESGSTDMNLAEETFSEYHLYTLPRPATLRDRESQQLSMIETRDVQAAPRYLTQGGGPVMAQLRLVNSKSAGPGVPLPAGRVRIFEPDASGALQFTGESAIGHTPVDETFTVDVGLAFDLVAERRDVENRRISDREREYDVEIKLRNRKSEAVTIVVEEPVHGDFDVLKKSHPFTVKNATTIQFEIAVPAGQEVVVTYTARARY